LDGGGDHTCAIDKSGGVSCWGWNNFGQLGDGTQTNHAVPLATGVTGAKSIAAGNDHTCAVTATQVACWGYNGDGQVGTGGTSSHETTPVAVAGTAGALAVAAGGTHSCAITPGKTVVCWGANGSGQIGDGTTSERDIATPVNNL